MQLRKLKEVIEQTINRELNNIQFPLFYEKINNENHINHTANPTNNHDECRSKSIDA